MVGRKKKNKQLASRNDVELAKQTTDLVLEQTAACDIDAGAPESLEDKIYSVPPVPCSCSLGMSHGSRC